jgi:DHA1 family multidrug resistance protein-like MFS transporter
LSSTIVSEEQARRNVNYLASLDMIISLGFGLIMPLFPLYLQYLSKNASDVGLQIGILFSMFVLTRAILATPFGNLSDRIGRKKLILVGSFLYAILAILFTVPNTWVGLLFVRALQGVASAMVWPVSEALIIDSTPPHMRGRAMGKVVMMSNLGMVIGPFVGGGLFGLMGLLGFSQGASYRFPFYFTAIAALTAFALVWKNVTDTHLPTAAETRLSLHELVHPSGVDKQGLRNLRMLNANAMMEGFSFASIGPLMALFLAFKFPELGEAFIPILIGLAMGLGALVAYPSGRLADRMGKKKMFVIGGTVSYIGTILIPFGWVLALVVLFLAMRSMAFQVSSPALRALQADVVPERVRGRLIGVLESMRNIGSVIGAPVGGLMWDTFHGANLGIKAFSGTNVPFLISGCLGLFSVSLILILVRDRGHADLLTLEGQA